MKKCCLLTTRSAQVDFSCLSTLCLFAWWGPNNTIWNSVTETSKCSILILSEIDAHPPTLNRWQRPGASMQIMYGVRNLSTACWRLEAVAKRSRKLNVALHYCCLPVKALLRYCRVPPVSWHIEWVDRRNVGVIGASPSEPHMLVTIALSKDDWSYSCLLWRLSTKTWIDFYTTKILPEMTTSSRGLPTKRGATEYRPLQRQLG